MAVRLFARARAAVEYALSEDHARTAIGVTMALITVLATVVAFLQQDAAIRSDRAERASERIGLEAVAYDVGRIVQTGTDYGVFRVWFEQLERSAWAAEQAEAGSGEVDPALAEALWTIEADLSDWVQEQSVLFREPYFDAETFATDFGRYEAELIVGPQVRAQHEHDAELARASAWDGRALTYVTILTVLAASLFFLGLAAGLGGVGRRILAITGATFASLSLAATVLAAAFPPTGVQPAAIDHIVDGSMSLARSNHVIGQPLSDEDRQHLEDALTASDAAVQAAPDYPGAYLARAEVKTTYADTLYFLEDRDEALVEWLLAGAIADFRTYLGQQPDDYAAWWNLGWVEYLADDPAASVEATNRALELTPDQFILYQNRALAELAMGGEAAADADIETSLDVAIDAGLDSTIAYFSLADFDIGRLAELRPDEADALREIQQRLREGQVALEALESPDPGADPAQLADLTVTALSVSPEGEFEELEPIEDGDVLSPAGRHGLRLDLELEEADEGTVISVRIWRDRLLDPGSSVDVAIDGDGADETLDIMSPYGRARFDLDPGSYELQVYADANLIGALSWEFEDQE